MEEVGSSVQFWVQDFERHKYGRVTKEGSEIKGKQVTSCEFHDEEFKALGEGRDNFLSCNSSTLERIPCAKETKTAS